MKRIAYATEWLYSVLLAPFAHVLRLLGYSPKRVTIIGWWGSETVGDIAILGQLFAELEGLCAARDIRVVSFDATLTRRSLRQLERADIEVVPLGLLSALALVTSRSVIFGGGPLMESPAMRFWKWNARVARFTGARVMLYANGIGPLRSAASEKAVIALLRTVPFIVVRDALAQRWVTERAGRTDTVLSFDPAFDYVRRERTDGVARKPQIALALRTPPASYLGGTDITAATDRFVGIVASALDAVADARDIRFVGLVMHSGHADSDDHAVYRQLRSRMRHAHLLHVAAGEHSLKQVVESLEESSAALTVRFHAMIFALATDTPFVAIDYARPEGKVSAAAADMGRAADVISWDAVEASSLASKLLAALDAPAPPPPDLLWAADVRRAVLRAAAG